MAGSGGSTRGGLARKDRAEKIALFRYQLIREVADESVTSRQRGPMVRALAQVEHPGPFGGTVTVSKDTHRPVDPGLAPRRVRWAQAQVSGADKPDSGPDLVVGSDPEA
ncbi:MAG: hypothetical protein ABJA86_11820 [Nocardioidaceae bacterium]